jgi:succinate-acetate transporter protein
MSTSQAYSGLSRPGWLTFAAVTLFAVGFLRIISAIYYFSDSARVVNVTNGALGDHLFVWGLWDLIIAVLAISAGFSLLSGNTFGRVIGYLWAINAIVQSFLIIEYAPWFGFGTLLLAMLVIYALSMSSDYRETRAP